MKLFCFTIKTTIISIVVTNYYIHFIIIINIVTIISIIFIVTTIIIIIIIHINTLLSQIDIVISYLYNHTNNHHCPIISILLQSLFFFCLSSIDSLYEEDEVGFFLFLLKDTIHSFSPNLGLTFVAFVLIRLGKAEKSTNSRTSRVGWTVLALFGVGATWATTFLFWRAICTSFLSFSSISLKSFNLCGTDFSSTGCTRMDAFVCSCLFFVLRSLVSSSSSSSSLWDYFLVFFFCCSTIIFYSFLAILKLLRPLSSSVIALASLFCFFSCWWCPSPSKELLLMSFLKQPS